MTRNNFSYTHGDNGSKPTAALDFKSNGRPGSEHFDWWWTSVITAINGHASEFDRLDADDDGVVDEADYANDANASTYKGVDIDSDGDGRVNSADTALNADYATNADKVDGNHWSDIKAFISNNYAPDPHGNGYHDPNFATKSAFDPHGNEKHNPNFALASDLSDKADDPHDNAAHDPNYATVTELSGKADDPHGNAAHDPDFATLTDLAGKADDPHGDAAHTPDYAKVSDLYTDENAQDAANALLAGGTDISLTYDDAGNNLSIDWTGSTSSYSDEDAQDAVGLNVGNALSYDDAAGAIAVSENAISHDNLSGVSSSDHHSKYTDENAQDAVGNILSNEFTYDDGSNLISLDSSVTDSYSDEDAQDAIGRNIGNALSYDDANGEVYVSEVDISHDNIGGVSSSDHHSRYTDSEARSAVNTFSGSHNDLSSVGSSDHHSRYTDSEAQSAVDTYTDEQAQDATLPQIGGGAGISTNYSDAGDGTTISLRSEGVFDEIKDMIVAGNNDIYVSNSDSSNEVQIYGDKFGGAHSDLSGVNSDDHHAKYTDSDVRDAIANQDELVGESVEITFLTTSTLFLPADSGSDWVIEDPNENKLHFEKGSGGTVMELEPDGDLLIEGTLTENASL